MSAEIEITRMTQILSVVPLGEAAVSRLEALPGVRVQQLPPQREAWDLPEELLRGPEILLCKLPPRNLDGMTQLKLIQISSVGYDNMRSFRLGERPLRVCNARGLFDTAIGEWVLAMMINLVRDLRGMIRNQEQGRWDRAAPFQQEIRDKVVGLWGYGGIGRETARLAKAFGMTVHVMTRSGVKPRQGIYVLPGTSDPDGVLPDRVFVSGQEKEFLSSLDFLVLALPHTRYSNGLIGEAQLRALRPTAFLLNPARGPIIQEQALLAALREGRIAGAALDTHFAYPLPAEHPLWKMPNVIMTPHISGAEKSSYFPQRIADLFTQNVERYLYGRPLLNMVTPEEWSEV
jgi:phosphoglycerate dehydrogenase-like enzyme